MKEEARQSFAVQVGPGGRKRNPMRMRWFKHVFIESNRVYLPNGYESGSHPRYLVVRLDFDGDFYTVGELVEEQ
jgi:hypothetical protein